MTIINNPTVRDFNLPTRTRGDAEFGAHTTLRAQSTLEVPDWYVEELRAEKTRTGKPTGWALRLEQAGPGRWNVKHPPGVAGAFEARILALREERAKLKTEVREQTQRAETTASEMRAVLARVVELENELAKLRGAGGAEPEGKPSNKGR